MDYAAFEKICKENGTTPTAITRKLGLQKGNAKAYERLTVDVKKGERDRLKAYASSQGLSLNSFVCSCVSYCVASGIDVSAVPALTDSLPD